MSGHDSHEVKLDESLLRIPPKSRWGQIWKVAAVLAVIGLGLTVVYGTADPRRFAYSYTFAFLTFMVLGLGSLFFVMVQHLAAASWSASVRRTAEFGMIGLPVLLVLWVPIWFQKDELYEWSTHVSHGAEHGGGDHGEGSHGDDEHAESLLGASLAQAQDHGDDGHGDDADHGAAAGHVEGGHGDDGGHGAGAHSGPEHELHGELLDHKAGYLNVGFWTVRSIVYLLIWTLLALVYFRWSTQQDESKDPALTRKMRGLAPVAMLLFGLSLTFAAFDWVMSLEPTWYSTIYGVCVFASGAVAAHAFVIVVTLSLKNAGLIGDAVNAEHYHDLGKLLFGFIVFWAYVSFSQMMLQWYAGIPEEAIYYHHRWNDGGWATYSMFLLFGFFVMPFLFLISRVIKRNLSLVALGASWMLVMTVVNAYWYVLPVHDPGHLSFHVLDVSTLFLVGGTYLAVVAFMMNRHRLIAVGDPTLPRALHHENA